MGDEEAATKQEEALTSPMFGQLPGLNGFPDGGRRRTRAWSSAVNRHLALTIFGGLLRYPWILRRLCICWCSTHVV